MGITKNGLVPVFLSGMIGMSGCSGMSHTQENSQNSYGVGVTTVNKNTHQRAIVVLNKYGTVICTSGLDGLDIAHSPLPIIGKGYAQIAGNPLQVINQGEFDVQRSADQLFTTIKFQNHEVMKIVNKDGNGTQYFSNTAEMNHYLESCQKNQKMLRH